MSNFPYLGVQIARLREAKGLSPQNLAQLVGVRDVTILNLEAGKFFKADLLEQILTSLGCHLTIMPDRNDGVLQLIFDNRQIADKYGNTESRDELQNSIDNLVGKHVEFVVEFNDPGQNLEEHYVDLRKINFEGINFDIVTEDTEVDDTVQE